MGGGLREGLQRRQPTLILFLSLSFISLAQLPLTLVSKMKIFSLLLSG